MASICFYFQVHQPFRIKDYRVFDIGNDQEYFSDDTDRDINNKKILNKVATKCYLPTNALLLELLEKHPEFKISFSFSGVVLEQLEQFSPETLRSFQKLVETGRVEVLDETFHHSLAFLYSKEEFRRQVKLHREKIQNLFGVTPVVFRHTEFIYNNDLAHEIESMGYKGILAEGADHVLEWRSPNFLYKPTGTKNLKLLLKNYRLSDDIAFRFSAQDWSGYPLTAPKFAEWVSQVNGAGEVVNLFMDYETFGEHQWEHSGIFEFLRQLPGEILKHPDNNFMTPSDVIAHYKPVAELDVPNFMSWADVERDLSAWIGNPMQHDALKSIYALEEEVVRTDNQDILRDWRRLQTSDHFYYMCTKYFNDGDVHKYFNPYNTPYEAFIAYMNVLADMRLRLDAEMQSNKEPKKIPVKSL